VITGTQNQPTDGLNESYSYDPFGNLQQSGNFNFIHEYTTANRLSGYSYDAAGNLLADGLGNTFTWDANEMISSSNGTSYFYDAEGSRVGKSGSAPTDTIYFGGRPVARFTGGAWTDLIYGAGSLLAEVPGTQTGAPVYRMTDPLGSSVGTLSSTGALTGGIQDYAPFGELFNGSSTSDPYKFTGKERDTESGNDYFSARYFGSSMGRFLSPDPLGGSLANPQSLNKYAYVLNDPLSNTDPTGLYVCADDPQGAISHCTSKQDKKFEAELNKLRGRDGDVGRAAAAYGKVGDVNGVTVGFADLSTKGENGKTDSTIGADASGHYMDNSAVTINSKIDGDSFAAAIGHEGSHVADAQDVVKSGLTEDGQAIHAGMNITPYQSEVRAWGVTQSILKSGNFTQHFDCGSSSPCDLGASPAMKNAFGVMTPVLPGNIPAEIDHILANQSVYNQGGSPMGPDNQGPSVVNGVTPRVTIPR